MSTGVTIVQECILASGESLAIYRTLFRIQFEYPRVRPSLISQLSIEPDGATGSHRHNMIHHVLLGTFDFDRLHRFFLRNDLDLHWLLSDRRYCFFIIYTFHLTDLNRRRLQHGRILL